MTDNSQAELREKVQDICDRVGAGLLPPTGAGAIMNLVTAYTNKHELQARIDELDALEKYYVPDDDYAIYPAIESRIIELKQELEKL